MELVQKLLLAAIAGERSAESTYKRCMAHALMEGYSGIASLFAALSRAEGIHWANHLRALKKTGFTGEIPDAEGEQSLSSTLDNLSRAVNVEAEEFKIMYPSWIRQIRRKFGNDFTAKIALLSMRWAGDAEKGHYQLLKDALVELGRGEDLDKGRFYLCSVCGTIHYRQEAPQELCEVCGHDPSFYIEVRAEQ